jgi:hypothetical protein
MISAMDDHYFGDLKALVGRNKSSCRGFFVGGRSIFCEGTQVIAQFEVNSTLITLSLIGATQALFSNFDLLRGW